MIVCVCHRVSDRDIARAAAGCESFESLQDELRVATACGACRECACALFENSRSAAPVEIHRHASPTAIERILLAA